MLWEWKTNFLIVGNMNQKIRAGFISYLNAYPYYFPFEQGFFSSLADYFFGNPAQLNNKISKWQLDISLISSMEYAQNFNDYILIDEIGLSSRGCVNSVNLYSKYPIEKLHSKKIGLTTKSATSKAIVKIILAQKGYTDIEYCDFSNLQDCDNFDAYLLIGDEALVDKTKFEHTYDLAQVWQDIYNMDILFAVAVIHKKSFQQNKEVLIKFSQKLKQAPHFSLQHPKFFSVCQEKFDLPIDIKKYFSNLDFSPHNKKEQRQFLFEKFYEFNLISQEIIE